MEKRMEKSGMEETEELEMNAKMVERADDIDNAAYRYLAELLELDEDEAKERFPWNIEILRKVFDSSVSILQEYGHTVCNPYVATSENGRRYRCTLSECGCKSCNCQDEMMEKERLLSNIEDAVAITGLKIISGEEDSIIVREGSIDTDFEIRVSQHAG